MNNNKCPKCDKKTYWKKISSGGDGLQFCSKCNWVEPTDRIWNPEKRKIFEFYVKPKGSNKSKKVSFLARR